MADALIPQYSEVARRNILIESLGGPKDVFYYLDNFPEEIYNKSPDSHLYKYMRTLLGDSGVNWLKKNFLEARIAFEELGLDAFDLDKFFGSPFSFGRIVEENLSDDPYGIISKDQWELIRAQNARYRNRALDYMNGARAGNTPLGIRLVAKAGIGHDVEIIENYKYLFDVHSDDPLGLDYFGKTYSTEEFVVLPRQEIAQNEQQMIVVQGDIYPTSGSFSLVYNGTPTIGSMYSYTDTSGTTDYNGIIPFDGTADHIRLALEALPEINEGDVSVTGGPGPTEPFIITFQGQLAQKDILQLEIVNNMINGTTPVAMRIITIQGGHETIDTLATIPPGDVHNLTSAMDRIRPQTGLMTVGQATGLRTRSNWKQSTGSSEYREVVRFVTGNPSVQWPTESNRPEHWIRAYDEKQSLRVSGDLQYHYTGFHNVVSAEASTLFDQGQLADKALADYSEPLFITSQTEGAGSNDPISMINGIYPVDYQDLPGVPPIRYKEDQYWSSQNWDTQGFSIDQVQDEWLILRLPTVKAVNYLSFDIYRDDIKISLDYDTSDGTEPNWVPVTPVDPYSDVIVRNQNTWASIGLTFSDRFGELIWTRSIRVTLHRLSSDLDYWGYPIQIKNLRLARNVS